MRGSICVYVVAALVLFPSPTMGQEDPRILRIREWYEQIEGARHAYRHTTRPLLDEESGEVYDSAHVYYDGNALRYVKATGGGGDSFHTSHFYFWDDKLIFAFVVADDVHGNHSEARYYFADDDVIRVLATRNGMEDFGDDGAQSRTANAILKEAAAYLRPIRPDAAGTQSSGEYQEQESIRQRAPPLQGVSTAQVHGPYSDNLLWGALAVLIVASGIGLAYHGATRKSSVNDDALAQRVVLQGDVEPAAPVPEARASAHTGIPPVADAVLEATASEAHQARATNETKQIRAVAIGAALGVFLPWYHAAGRGGEHTLLGFSTTEGGLTLLALGLGFIGLTNVSLRRFQPWFFLVATALPLYRLASIERMSLVLDRLELHARPGFGLLMTAVLAGLGAFLVYQRLGRKVRRQVLMAGGTAGILLVAWGFIPPADVKAWDEQQSAKEASVIEQPKPQRAECDRLDAEKVLTNRVAGYSPMHNARLGRSTTWQAIGPCSWNVDGIAGWRDPITNEPTGIRFVATLLGGNGHYEVYTFVQTGMWP